MAGVKRASSLADVSYCCVSGHRNGCRFCHDMSSQHNSKVLAENNLQLLDTKELRTLLLQNDNTLLPPVTFSFSVFSLQVLNIKRALRHVRVLLESGQLNHSKAQLC